jgi:DNA repair protein RecO (recombination protein O)
MEITGFITRKVNYSESDLIITMITLEHGKIDLIGRGARRSKKRFEAGLSYNILYSGQASSQKNSSLWFLRDLSVTEQFPSLLSNYKKISAAAYGTELMREISPYQQVESVLFNLLHIFYRTLDQTTEISPLVAWLQYHTLVDGGFMAPFSHCSSCGKTRITGVWTFNSLEGGILCESCGNGATNWFKSSNIEWITSPTPKGYNKEAAQQITPLLTALVTNIIGKKLKSTSLLIY